jgi:hypothetical protein
MSGHYHYEYAEARHDHRGQYADERHEHYREYAEYSHGHHGLDGLIAGLREDLRHAEERIRELEGDHSAALERIAALEKQTPQARQLQYEADLAAADLAESGYDPGAYGPPVGADRHGRGCQRPYYNAEPDDDQVGVPERQTGVAAMRRLTREHPLDPDPDEDQAEEPEPEPYDPGPEIDHEGGMSEYRYVLPEDYERGQL